MSEYDTGRYYDRQGNVISLFQWATLRETPDYFRIAEDYIGLAEGGMDRVSTVWLGLNHNFWGGPPLIFETMIFWFWPDQHEEDQDQWRYPTEEAALAGHDQVVAMLKDRAGV